MDLLIWAVLIAWFLLIVFNIAAVMIQHDLPGRFLRQYRLNRRGNVWTLRALKLAYKYNFDGLLCKLGFHAWQYADDVTSHYTPPASAEHVKVGCKRWLCGK